MLVISKFRDYYDSAVGAGIDKSVVYERHEKKAKLPDVIKNLDTSRWSNEFTQQYWGKIPKGEEDYYYFIIGFCGKLYIGYKFIRSNKDNVKYIDSIIHNRDEFNKRLNFVDKKSWGDKRYGKRKQARFDTFLNNVDNYDATDIFRKFNTPIFLYTTERKAEDCFIINPILKDYEFVKVIDPYTAFQEIQMYVSGVLGIIKDGDQSVPTEKQKVQQYGMDKWSFRREPSK